MKSLLIEPLEARIAPATLTIGTPASILEGDSGTKTLNFTVTLDEAPAEGSTVTVDFQTVDGTATAGSDYVALSDTLTFAAGETSKTISIEINGDLEGEDDETFKIQLSNAVNATLGTAEATGTILNDAKLSITAPEAILEGDGEPKEMIFTVSLVEGYTKPVTVQYQTANGTATATSDFTAKSGTLTFEPGGETTRTIVVPVIGDETDESDETFSVQLTQPTNATIQTATATGTILSDDTTLSINSPTVVEGDSGEKLMAFTVTLSKSLSRAVTVQYQTEDGTAIAGSDYLAKNGTLTFEPGQTTQTILVPIIGDTVGEADETFTVKLSDAVNASISEPANPEETPGTGTILNDAKLSISAPEAIVEGESGEQMMVFTVTLTEGFDKAVSVQYRTVDGTATAGSDYVNTTGTLTFAPGETTKTISVPILGDLNPEDNETFRVVLSQPVEAAIQTGGATGTILTDDAKLSISSQELLEGDTGEKMMTFTVTLNASLNRPVTVKYRTVDGAAVAGSDYEETIGELTFAPGETSKTIQVPIIGDVIGEADETFTIELSDAENAAIETAVGTGTILNDAKLSITNQQLVEGDEGESMMVFTVTLAEGFDQAVTVAYQTANGSGTAGADYTATSGTLTFAPGELSKTIEVPILGDTTVEGDETFTVQLSEPTHAAIQTGSATGTILTDDAKLSISSQELLEGDEGEKMMTFTVTLNASLSRPVTVKYRTVDGTAVAGSDYTEKIGELTFAPGETSKTIQVPIIGDVVGEADETFTVELSEAENASIETAVGTGTILNDTKLTISDQQIVEGNDGAKLMVFTVTLTDGLEQPVTVNYQTENGTATAGANSDYLAASGTLTFAPGETTKTIEVPILGDTTVEGDETFTVKLSQATNATVSKDTGTGRILSDDALLSISDQELLEGDEGEKMMTFTVTLNANLNRPVTVKYRTVDGTAVAGSDYIAKVGELTFAPGETSKTIQVPIIGDLEGEADETFTIELTEAENASIATATATGTILNDAKLTVSAPQPLDEGNSGQKPMVFTVTLTEGGNEAVKVRYALDGTAVSTGPNPDYTVGATSGELVFEPGTTTQSVVVNVLGDTWKEADETVRLQLSSAENATITEASATGTIRNDDLITINDVVITEGDSGYSYAVVTLTLATPMATGEQLVVKYNTVDLTATGSGALADYEGIEETTIVFAPGETTKTIQIKILSDRSYETSTVGTGENAVRAEQFKLQLISGTIQKTGEDGEVLRTLDFSDKAGTVTITDNDALPTVSISDVRVLEGGVGTGGTAKFIVSLSEVTDKDIKVRYSTVNGPTPDGAMAGEDFTGVVAGEVIIPAGQKTVEIEIPIIGDSEAELTETFKVKLLEDVPGDSTQQYTPRLDGKKLTITRGEATGTIVNDEVRVEIVPVEEVDVEDCETEKEVKFTVRLIGTLTQAVTVNLTAQDGTAISSGAFKDYELVTQSLTFDVNDQGPKEVTVKIFGDLYKEADETFKLVLTADTDNVSLGDASGRLEHTVTIKDDATDVVPTASISYEGPVDGVLEGGKATFKVTLSAPSNVDIEVPFDLVNGTATGGQSSGNDFVKGSNLKVVIPAGQTSATFTVDTIDDALTENTETFTVKLTAPGDAATAKYSTVDETDSVEVKILDNDPNAPLPSLTISDVTIVEGNPGEVDQNGQPVKRYAIFTIKLSSVAGRDVKVRAATLPGLTGDGIAIAGEDYVAKDEEITIHAGTQTAEFKVEIIGDNDIESTERFIVRLSGAENANIATAQAVGTIQNDDSQFEIWFEKDGVFTKTLTVDEEGANNAEKEVRFIIRRLGEDLSGTSVARYTTADGVDYMDGSTKIRGAVGSGVRPDFTPVMGSYEFADGQRDSEVFTIKINPDGSYEGLEEFRVMIEGAVGNHGTVRITDNEAKPTVIITNASVLEGDRSSSNRQQSTLIFQVTLSHIDETGVSMAYNTADDTTTGAHKATSAAAGSIVDKSDYVSLSNGQLVFAPGETEKTVSVTVLGDNRDEYDETFKLVLSGLQGGATFGVDGDDQPLTSLSATGTITDNDAEAVVSITDLVKPKSGSSTEYEFTTYSESDTLSAGKYFLVTLTGETEKLVTVKYSTRSSADANPDVNVYAIAGEDFIGVTDGIITFDPNASTESARTLQQIKIEMINDTIVEGDQSFEVLLTEADGATFNDRRGVAVIAEDTSDDPLLTINDIRLVEGNDPFNPQNAKFTVTLATKAQRPVTINYATADGTGKATGLFADYIATSGQITFAPGETSQEISVQVLNDTFKEADETFKVQLSGLQSGNADVKFLAADGSTGTGAGTATIENGDDTIIGVGIRDTKVLEGAGVKLEVERSIAPEANTSATYNVAVRNGTAVLNSDYRVTAQNPKGTVTIAAGQTIGSFEEYGTINDNAFEFAEHFFADLSGVPAGTEVVKSSARVEVFSDDYRFVNSRTIQWIDLDGDLVTLKVSKGTLDNNNFSWRADGNSIYTSAVGGIALNTLNLYSREFQGANVTITAERQPGFTGDANGLLGDGRVNVGFIRAGAMSGDGINFFGIDLGTVKVDGDLGRIDVGDRTMTGGPSLRKLEVFSLGAHPESTNLYFKDANGQNVPATSSYIQGTVGTIDVRTDFAGFLRVSGSIFGDINSLKIGGALRGLEDFDQTGTITFTGTLGKATIGEIIGGEGSLSGRIEGDAQHVGNINSITVRGDISGNSGIGSGVIAASSIGKVKAARLLGGAGDDSGQIRAGVLSNVNIQEDVIGYIGARSGGILADSGFGVKTGVGAGNVKIGGRLIGGSGESSGLVYSQGNFTGVTIGGKVAAGENVLFSDITAVVTGGEGANSGRIEALGAIKKLQLGSKGDLAEADEQRVSLKGSLGAGSGTIDARGGIGSANLFGAIQGDKGAGSGALSAAILKKAHVYGDLQGGNANNSGVIAVDGRIGSLVIDGSILGGSSEVETEDSAATVVNTTGAVLAGQINSMTVKGSVIAGRNLGAGLSGSASIAVNGVLGKLTIAGDLLGHDHTLAEDGSVIEEENVYAKILVFGDAKRAAIGKLKIGGDVALAEISAGVSIRSGQFGFPVNADAWIKSVEIGGDVRGMSITAGANKGPDGIFGTDDDGVLNAHPLAQINDAKRFSSIAKVIIKGTATAETEIGADVPLPFGLIAQYVGSVKVGNQSVSLLKGAGNDKFPGKEIADLESFRVIELPTA